MNVEIFNGINKRDKSVNAPEKTNKNFNSSTFVRRFLVLVVKRKTFKWLELVLLKVTLSGLEWQKRLCHTKNALEVSGDNLRLKQSVRISCVTMLVNAQVFFLICDRV